jgi:endonuclease/exonuclease/phosphatase family metal-dependent hydrolase
MAVHPDQKARRLARFFIGSLVWIIFSAALFAAAPVAAKCALKPTPVALPDADDHQLLLATQNLWRLVDDHPDTFSDRPAESDYFQQRLDAVARYIGETLRYPHLLALQEVEHPRLLETLVQRIRAAGGPQYSVAMKEGLDPSGIDVALLYRTPVVVDAVTSPFHSRRYKRSPLYSRPPLVVSVAQPLSFQLVVVHLRSGINLEDARKGKNVQEKRFRQASALREWMDERQQNNQKVIIAGDFNSAFGDAIYEQPIALLQTPPFVSAWDALPEKERFSYIYQCRPQAIDNILYPPDIAEIVSQVAVTRGNAGYQYYLYKKKPPYLISDHDALGVYLQYE